MATTKKNYFHQPNFRSSEPMFEFEESDLWTSSNQVDYRKSIHNSRSMNKSGKNNGERVVVGGTASSLPINVPDWSKILRDDYRGMDHRSRYQDVEFEDAEDEEEENRVPPHEFLARQFARAGGVGSFSVHEGVGRTLKGRDLSRVRDAIWKKTGFED